MHNIRSKGEFVSLVESLVKDLKANPETWTNLTLVDYLEAISSWTEDMDGCYKNNNLPIPIDVNWNVFADILSAAKVYE